MTKRFNYYISEKQFSLIIGSNWIIFRLFFYQNFTYKLEFYFRFWGVEIHRVKAPFKTSQKKKQQKQIKILLNKKRTRHHSSRIADSLPSVFSMEYWKQTWKTTRNGALKHKNGLMQKWNLMLSIVSDTKKPKWFFYKVKSYVVTLRFCFCLRYFCACLYLLESEGA